MLTPPGDHDEFNHVRQFSVLLSIIFKVEPVFLFLVASEARPPAGVATDRRPLHMTQDRGCILTSLGVGWLPPVGLTGSRVASPGRRGKNVEGGDEHSIGKRIHNAYDVFLA